jgi:hypothetical protein
MRASDRIWTTQIRVQLRRRITNCKAIHPIRYGSITNQLCTLGDNCNDLLYGLPCCLGQSVNKSYAERRKDSRFSHTSRAALPIQIKWVSDGTS